MRRKTSLLIWVTACALPLLAAAAGTARADTVTTISQLSGFHQMVVDTSVSPGYIFMAGNNSIVVTDLHGTYVTSLDTADGVAGIALSPDGSTLYAALTAGTEADSIAAITVSATPTRATTYLLGTGDVPYSLAVQSGKLWVSYGDGAATDPGRIGDVDLTTGIFGAQATNSTWPSPPDLAADPSDTGVLVSVLPGVAPATAETFTTTTDSDSATQLSAQGVLGAAGSMCSNEHQLAVFPGGTEFIAACQSPLNENVYSTTDISGSPVSQYGTGSSFPGGVAIDADGLVAVGTYGSPSAIYVYNSDGTLLNVFTVTGPDSLVDASGLAWEDAAAGPQLAAMLAPLSGPQTYSLNVFGQPAVTQSALTLSTPPTAVLGAAVTLTGSLTLSNGAPLPQGTTVTVTRSGPGGPETVGSATPGSDGSFTVTDPDAPAATGAYTYTAAYAGDATVTTSATATATVNVGLNTASLSINGPSSANVGTSIPLTGTLAFDAGTVPAGTPLTVTRTVSGGVSKLLPPVSTGAGGTFTLADTPAMAGTYTYTVGYAGDPTTAAASASHKVSVARAPVSLTLTSGSGTTFTYEPTIHVTAHLGTTDKNRTVSIYAQWFGSKGKSLLKTGTVNSSGDLTVTYQAKHSTTLSAVFSGDPEYARKTVARAVYVRASVSESIRGYYASKHIGGVLYRLFHSNAVLSATGRVAPNKHGECVQFEVQEFFQGAWKPNVKTACVSLSKSSQALQTFGLNQADLGFPYRIRADYLASASDTTNLSADSAWLYLMVEK